MRVTGLSAVTLATTDMPRATAFYEALGFERLFGGPEAEFTSYEAGDGYLNLILTHGGARWTWWGRTIFYVEDVDSFHRNALVQGLKPSTEPADAHWGERYFHITDPDGHELSFAKPL
ncbi:MAG: VOC family protein [Rhodovibrionaceae bacterium]